MNFRNWFRSSLKNALITHSQPAASKRASRCRLTVESLEDRVTPAMLGYDPPTVRVIYEGVVTVGFGGQPVPEYLSNVPLDTFLTFQGDVQEDSPELLNDLTYTWSVTNEGAPYLLPSGTITNDSEFAFAPSMIGNYVISLDVTNTAGGETTTPVSVTVTGMSANSLNNLYYYRLNYSNPPLVGTPVAVTMQANETSVNTLIEAVNVVGPPIDSYNAMSIEIVHPVIITLNLASGSYHDVIVNLQPSVTLIINGEDGSATFVGGSPALIVNSGDVIVHDTNFQNATNAPTILVNGGNLTLRNDTIQESTDFAAAAISVTGGSVDLGTTADPGGNILNVNGTGELIDNTGPGTITAVGNTFEQNAVALGVVTFGSADAVYVSDPGYLQRGVDAVAVGGAVYVEAGHNGGAYTVGSKLLTINFQGGSTVALRPDPLAPELTDLIVSGTAGTDAIKFNAGGTAYPIEADVGQWPKGRFSPTGRIIAYGGAGDDDIQVAGNINQSAWLYGEGGNDRLKGGASNDVLLGGAGDDFLAGDNGRDLMLGGIGADRILGNAGDDILIAGTTDFDANEAALALIMQEWTRIDATFAVRVGHLETGNGLNAGYLLTDNTVHDDHTADVLTGAEGNDWFLFNNDGDGGVRDRATDLSTFETQFAQDIDWLNQ